jgi:ABC-type Zn uptake system ZnuABC Zn-binding protein ZnuA
LTISLILVLAAGCAGPATPDDTVTGAAATSLPTLTSAGLEAGEKLRVVATTNIVGDVARQVGGDAIDLTLLLPPGTDPHSYQARPDDLRKLNAADVVFINGLHLEEAMAPVLEKLDSGAPVIAVNTGVATLELDEAHADADPHTWMDVRNVQQWVETIAAVLAALDPAHAEEFAANAAAYQTQLAALHAEITATAAAIPAERRKFVTDHDNLGYLAQAYGFTIAGAVIPSLSTLAAPSAQELAALQQQVAQEGVTAILVGTTVNPDVAQQIAADTGAVVTPIYTDSLSDASGPAATYIDMMRYNLAQIAAVLE